jgi:hypothetical protein
MHQDDEIPLDELTRLQISVARRADELARDCKVRTPLNIHCWLMAESEHIDRSLAASTARVLELEEQLEKYQTIHGQREQVESREEDE